MIPRTIPTWQTLSWQEQLGQLVTDPRQLFELLELDPQLLPGAERAHALFPLRATRSYVARMSKGDPNDPLLRQILPLAEELSSPAHYSSDPLKEDRFCAAKGLIHKYQGRVLLLAAPQCAVNCRYCFRREFDYLGNSPSRDEWREALAYIAADSSIDEVILSGGDPLVVADKQLGWLIAQLEGIAHVQRLRIHSRLPVVLPERITPGLVALLEQTRLHCVVVLHCNHPQELNDEMAAALAALRRANITLLNQAVLLRTVNDHATTLAELSKRLFAHGVLPYYLHLLDRVNGAAHFEVDEAAARSLNRALLATLPGYLVPRLVREHAGAPSKLPII